MRLCKLFSALALTCGHLLAFAAASDVPALPYWGRYTASGGESFIITRWPDDPSKAAVYDSRSATFSPLERTRAGVCAEACATRIAFSAASSLGSKSMTFMSRGRTVHARRDPIRISDLSFMHGDAELKGRLWSPTTAGKHPAVLLIGGTGKNLRDDFRIYPYLLVKAGYMVLAFDKEGCGESGGDRTKGEEGIDALAQQNEAGLQALRQLGNVDPQRVGVLGISHGAWVAVRLARKDTGVAFVIAIVGGGVPVWEATLHEVHQRLLKSQEPAAVQAGDAFMVKVFDALRSGDADALPKLINGFKDETWFNQTPVAPFVGAPDEVVVSIGKQRWADELSYDPEEDLREMHIPILAIEGDRDESTPPEQNLAAFSAISQPAATVVMLPGANHRQAMNDDESLHYSPRLEPALTTWVKNLAMSRMSSRK